MKLWLPHPLWPRFANGLSTPGLAGDGLGSVRLSERLRLAELHLQGYPLGFLCRLVLEKPAQRILQGVRRDQKNGGYPQQDQSRDRSEYSFDFELCFHRPGPAPRR